MELDAKKFLNSRTIFVGEHPRIAAFCRSAIAQRLVESIDIYVGGKRRACAVSSAIVKQFKAVTSHSEEQIHALSTVVNIFPSNSTMLHPSKAQIVIVDDIGTVSPGILFEVIMPLHNNTIIGFDRDGSNLESYRNLFKII